MGWTRSSCVPTNSTSCGNTSPSPITRFAAECETTKELMDGLFAATYPSPRLLGAGSTRKVWTLPYGLVLKVRRHDSLPPEELAWRGGKPYKPHLELRRVVSNLRELGVAIAFPRLVPRIYGAMVECYERDTPRPNILIVESVEQTLHDLMPDESHGVDLEHLYISPAGELLVTDPRFRSERDSPELCTPENRLANFFRYGDGSGLSEGLWLGNIGVLPSGRRVIVDSANLPAKIPALHKATASDRANRADNVHLMQTYGQIRELVAQGHQPSFAWTTVPSRVQGVVQDTALNSCAPSNIRV